MRNKNILRFVMFSFMFGMFLSFISVNAYADTLKITGTKVEDNKLSKDCDGKICYTFNGDYLIIKQSTFAIVWTNRQLSESEKVDFTVQAKKIDPSLKNGIKEDLIFTTSSTVTKQQNKNNYNIYTITKRINGYLFRVEKGGVSHIVYGSLGDTPSVPMVTPGVPVTPVIPPTQTEAPPSEEPSKKPSEDPEESKAPSNPSDEDKTPSDENQNSSEETLNPVNSKEPALSGDSNSLNTVEPTDLDNSPNNGELDDTTIIEDNKVPLANNASGQVKDTNSSVVKGAVSPQTNDNFNIGLYLTIMCTTFTLIGIGLIIKIKRSK